MYIVVGLAILLFCWLKDSFLISDFFGLFGSNDKPAPPKKKTELEKRWDRQHNNPNLKYDSRGKIIINDTKEYYEDIIKYSNEEMNKRIYEGKYTPKD